MNKQEVYIRFVEEGKEAELRLSNIDNQHKLAIIQGLFQFFNIEVDLEEMAKLYNRTAKAYRDFFNQLETCEPDEKESKKELQYNFNPSEYETLSNNNDNINESKNQEEIPDYYVTGIKYRNNEPHYKCRYICPCGNEGNHYVPINTVFVNCHTCGKQLKISPATQFGWVQKDKNPEIYRDEFGNFFVAGEFKRSIKTLADVEQ
jgi:hypothetical protein